MISEINYQGTVLQSTPMILQAFTEFFSNLYKEAVVPQFDPTALLPQCDNVSSLDRPFTEREIHRAVVGLADNKASGPDGLPNEFHKQSWEITKPQVLAVFDELYNGTLSLVEANKANIVLIPKKDNPREISDFRPISIISYIPKLISKVLANRLAPLLPELVSPSQTGFIKGRFIAENFVTAREVLSHINDSDEAAFLLKLDFFKAYDTIAWSFLEQVLRSRGFPSKFVQWINLLLSTSTSTILLNGQQGQTFQHFRGLRQGDPMSPFLFVIAAEVLNKMLQAVATSIPTSISDRLPWPFLVLQYADDTLIFSSARGRTAQLLNITLKVFSAVSGLHVNRTKSSIVPFNMANSMTDSIVQLFACSRASLPIAYLGLPLSYSKPSREWFQSFINRVDTRLAGWKGSLLSRAGRILLTDAVLSTIPIYAMSVFKFPLWVINELDRIRKKFIWSNSAHNRRGVHLVAWQRVCLPKKVGGLGLHDLKLHNMAMLLRWWWILHHRSDSQWTIIAARLFSKRNCVVPPLLWNKEGSFFWRELFTLRYLFQISTTRIVGNGGNTSFWYDRWGGRPLRFLLPNQENPRRPLISLYRGIPQLHNMLPMLRSFSDTATLQEMPVLRGWDVKDGIRWRWSSNGEFSVAALYAAFMLPGKTISPCTKIWKLRVPPTVRLFLYLLASDRLLTQAQLSKRGIAISPKCVLCDEGLLETAEHLFFQCDFTKNFWTVLGAGQNLCIPRFTVSIRDSISDFLHMNLSNPAGRVLAATGFWMLWLERNNRVFRSATRTVRELTEGVRAQGQAFLEHC